MTLKSSSKGSIPPLLILAVVLMVWVRPSVAFDWSELASPNSELYECLVDELGEALVKKLRKGRPGDRKERRRVKMAIGQCRNEVAVAEGTGHPPYEGPLFDAMSQIDDEADADKGIANVRAAGVTKLALFARSKKRLHENEQFVLDLAHEHPDLIVLGAPKYFRHGDDLSARYIKATVEGAREHGYHFIGEILYTHGDKAEGAATGRGERFTDPAAHGTQKLLAAIAPLDIPLMVHFENYAWERDAPRFHRLFEQWPNQVFIIPHMAFATHEQATEMLSRHRNVFMTISKKERAMRGFSDPEKAGAIGTSLVNSRFELRDRWREVLIRFQDQLLFATDPHWPQLWETYQQPVQMHRIVLGQLPRQAAEKIAYKNAERLYGVKVK